MKPLFTDRPEAWTRASRASISAADYASPLTVYESQNKAEKAVMWWCLAGAAVVVVLIAMGVL